MLYVLNIIFIMKYIILYFSCFFFIQINYAQFTLVPDSNFEQALIDLGIDTDGLNGQFLTENAIGILNLQLPDKDISNTTGLEAFVDLHNLNLNGNLFTEIDLSVLPPNTMHTLRLQRNNLTNIDLTRVPNIVNLFLNDNLFTEVDASNLGSVWILAVTDCPSLTSLIVTNNNVQHLHINDTAIETIDLSTANNLKEFYCTHTPMENLDFSNNQEIKIISTSNTPLNSINLPNNPYLDFIYVSNTLLNEIDLTNCPNLTYLHCNDNTGITNLNLTQNTILEELYCKNSALTSLNLHQNTALKNLQLTNNLINGTLDLSNNINLDNVNINYNPLELITLPISSILRELRLDETLITEIDLSQNSNIREVFLLNTPNLEFVNMQNGNNEELFVFAAPSSPFLTCIMVDDPSATNGNIAYNHDITTLVGSIQECEDLNVSNNQLNLEINIYPNPVKNILQVENNANIVINNIEIFTLLGKQVKKETTNFSQLNLSNINQGIYFIKINTDKGMLTKKIIKN